MRRCAASVSRLNHTSHRICGGLTSWRSFSRSVQRDAVETRGSVHDVPSINISRTVLGNDHDQRAERLLRKVAVYLPSRFGGPAEDTAKNDRALGQLLVEGISDSITVDILYELAVVKGQWKAAVWIVQRLLESYNIESLQDDRLDGLVPGSQDMPTLEQLTNHKIETLHDLYQSGPKTSINAWLATPDAKVRLDHQRLGCIWRSLGLMTLACIRDKSIAGGSVKPEILEMLALFHHHGLMPASVYNYVPSDQEDAVQQPATLYLLSSRIMVALSDAAWRARESAALEHKEASTRLEKLGSSVRANIEAVKPQMWLELILWSCIHGGWVHAGLDILTAVCRETRPPWRALSWRKTLRDYLGIASTTNVDWADELTAFQLSRKGKHDPEVIQLERTLSSELVNAYVDAVIDTIADHKGRQIPAAEAFGVIAEFRKFLEASQLHLHGSTWDATLLRIAEDNRDIITRLDILEEVVRLWPIMGDELSSNNGQSKPAYILDGNAALLGLLHRAFKYQISVGSLAGASKVLGLIRTCVDDSREKSVNDFFTSRMLDRRRPARISKHDVFSGIQHPNFEAQIPVQSMVAFFDLVIQTSSFDLGRALLEDTGIVEPLLPVSQWGEPELASSLVRFAIASNNDDLLEKIVQARNEKLSLLDNAKAKLDPVMSSMLSESFVTRSWTSSRQILKHIRNSSKYPLDPRCIAVLAAEIIKIGNSADAGSARKVLADLITHDSGSKGAFSDEGQNLFKVMTLVDQQCAALARKLRVHTSLYAPLADNFNVILAAVAQQQGSSKAMQLITTMTDSADQQLAEATKIVNLAGNKLYLRWPLSPNITTYVIVLKRALQESLPDGSGGIKDAASQKTIKEAIDGMRVVSRGRDDLVLAEVRIALMELKLGHMEAELVKLCGIGKSSDEVVLEDMDT